MSDLETLRAADLSVRRSYAIDDVEMRAGTGDTLTLEGHASVTDHPYEITDALGSFSETIRSGAFEYTLRNKPDVMLLTNHGGLPLARTKSGTLRLSEDSTGLLVRAQLEPTDPDVQRIQPKMERGDLNEMSFAFRVREQEWSADYTDRQITSVNLHKGDVSIVNYGANPATEAALRGLSDLLDLAELDATITALRTGQDADLSLVERAVKALNDLIPEQEAPVSLTSGLDLLARSSARRYVDF